MSNTLADHISLCNFQYQPPNATQGTGLACSETGFTVVSFLCGKQGYQVAMSKKHISGGNSPTAPKC